MKLQVTLGEHPEIEEPLQEAPAEMIDALRETLRSMGYDPDREASFLDFPFQEPYRISVAGFNTDTLENLIRLVESKAKLIRKAMGITELPIALDKDTLIFSWFHTPQSLEEEKACNDFFALLAGMAKRPARVLAVERPVENEKYAFRCFLLRLGMIGGEYAETRRVLLRNLSGNSSVKSGKRKSRKE
jgi:hypothetical protein